MHLAPLARRLLTSAAALLALALPAAAQRGRVVAPPTQ
ncbi:MAG: hypothetical protein JWM27_4041, partial [Gemmatimonadetes bacterium]|nr:hypothetical protein [Gemmatimonadota bacterium]